MNNPKGIPPARWRSFALIVALALGPFAAMADSFQPVSRFDPSFAPSMTAGGDSGVPILSADGRYVLFASTAANLTTLSNGAALPALFPAPLNVFLRDRTNGTTTLISANSSATGGGNGDSLPRAISTNGQYVLFESSAGNLVPIDTNNVADIFVRDIINNSNLLVSMNTNGVPGNGVSRSATMTPDGRYVAFVSAASDLVPGDTNNIPDIFVRDLVTGTTTLVSAHAAGTSTGILPNGSSESPAMTPDGRCVVFYSTATNLVAGVRTIGEVYVRDLQAGLTTWVSSAARSNFLFAVGSTNEASCNFEISDNANFIAYEACTNPAIAGSESGIILRYNLLTGFTDLVYTNANVQSTSYPTNSYQSIHSLDMTPDGRFIAFLANVGDTTGSNTAIYVWDAQTGSNTLVSANTNNAISSTAICSAPAISTNGQFIAFLSSATDLATNPLTDVYHLYRRDTVAGATQLIDVDLNGAGSGVDYEGVPSLSADGHLAGFNSTSGTLVSNDLNHASDVFVRDLNDQTTELVSVRDPGLPSLTPDGSSGLFQYSISSNGRWVAFASEADDLGTTATGGLRNIFVRDLLTGSNTLVSADTNGLPGAGVSTEPSISGNGRYVAFSSYATNLVAGDTNNAEDVFVRDLQLGVTIPVSLAANSLVPPQYDSYLPIISADGRYVLYRAKSQNPSSGRENLLLCDLQLGTTYALTTNNIYNPGAVVDAMTPDGRGVAFTGKVGASTQLAVWNSPTAALIYSNAAGSVSYVSISPNGRRVAYVSGSLYVADLASNSNLLVSAGPFNLHPGLSFSADGNFLAYATAATNTTADKNNTNDVYLYNVLTGSNTLVSQSYNSNSAAKGPSDSPAISADGRFVVYRSSATNLVAGVTNGVAELFVYDAWTGTNSFLTQNHFGTAPANSHSRTPIFSGDGRTVVFQSWASDLNSTGDFNSTADVFTYAFFYLDIAQGNSPLTGPTLVWPAAPGQTYQVQYKDNLNDAMWQNQAGTLVITGNQAYLTNTPPVANQRFYRVMAQ